MSFAVLKFNPDFQTNMLSIFGCAKRPLFPAESGNKHNLNPMNVLFDHEKLAGKERLRGIVSMLVGLIKANSDYRLHEGD
jgi:hypothetical protein